jgi:aminopeptidase N
VEAPLFIALGQEFPGLVLVDLHHKDGPYLRDDLHAWTVSHELAHQWWSMEVGSDARDSPWLDEALASHGSAIVAQATLGRDAIELRYDQDIRAPLAELRRTGEGDLRADLPGEAYDIYQYSAIVYGRAALFVDAVQRTLGEQAFSKAMHAYLDAHRGSMANADDLLKEWRKQASDPDAIDALYRAMIEGTADAPP